MGCGDVMGSLYRTPLFASRKLIDKSESSCYSHLSPSPIAKTAQRRAPKALARCLHLERW